MQSERTVFLATPYPYCSGLICLKIDVDSWQGDHAMMNSGCNTFFHFNPMLRPVLQVYSDTDRNISVHNFQYKLIITRVFMSNINCSSAPDVSMIYLVYLIYLFC